MLPPDEVMTQTFLPAVRALVAGRLRSQGISQARIATLLGITQASVSLYTTSGGERPYRALASLGLDKEGADSLAALLAEDAKRSPIYSVETLMSEWTSMLGRGDVCQAHRGLRPELAACDVCLHLYSAGGGQREATREVAAAVRLLEASPAFARVMPEVSVNIAYLPEGGSTVEDVVAIPGRIVRVRGSPMATQAPEFGASRHLARMLLLARTRSKSVRSAINLRWDDKIERLIRRMKLKEVEIGGRYPRDEADPVAAALAKKLSESEGGFDVVVDKGGPMTEPNAYLFGPGPVEVARSAVRLAEAYSARESPDL